MNAATAETVLTPTDSSAADVRSESEWMETPVLPDSSFFQQVYEPAEDTFLLMDAIEQDLDRIRQLNPLICLEVGCGSAAVLVAVRKSLPHVLCFGTDVNEDAFHTSIECARLNQVPDLMFVRTDLTNGLDDRLKNSIDLLIFNPPYVPTDESEIPSIGESSIFSSFAGGEDGMHVTRKLIHRMPDLLSDRGLFFLLLTRENNVPQVIRDMQSLGLEAEVRLSRRCGREHLSVVSGGRRITGEHNK